MTIPISEVLEEAAREVEPKSPRPCDCDSCDCGNSGDLRAVAWWDTATANAIAIRALAAEYKNCIVAEDTVIAWNRSVEFAGTGMGAHIPHDVEIPLYRAKELK